MIRRIFLPLMISVTLILLGLWSLSFTAHAAGPWYVSPSGNNSNNCLSLATACKTIAGAIGKATAGDAIIIAAGTYTENLTITKSLTLQGAGVGSSIVNGNAVGSVFTITPSIAVTITNMMIMNGSASSGGGIFNSGTLTISNTTVISNLAQTDGGGIYTKNRMRT